MNAPGIAFVAVADDVLLGRGLHARRVPLASGGKSAAAAPAQSGLGDLLADLLRRHLHKRLARRRIAAVQHVLVNVFRIEEAALVQHQPVLARSRTDCRRGPVQIFRVAGSL